MKTDISESELRKLIRNEVRKIVGEASIMDPPELGEPNYLSLDGPAVPSHMLGIDDEEMEDEYPVPPRVSRMSRAKKPCPSGKHMLAINEGCGCESKKEEKPHDELDQVVADILVNPMPCSGCGKIHQGECGSSGHKGHKGRAYMAKPQLYKISKYAEKLYNMLPDDYDMEDWQRSHLSGIADDISELYHSLDHKAYKGEI